MLEVNPRVITRPTEGQSPVSTGQVPGDGVRQKTGQEVRSNKGTEKDRSTQVELN